MTEMMSSSAVATDTDADAEAAERRFVVLNAVVLKQMGTAAAVAEATSLGLENVQAELDRLADEDLVAWVEPHVLPTEAGLAKLKAWAEVRYATVREDPRMPGWLDEFHVLNRRFLDVTTDWQALPVGTGRVPNDHSDPAYDDQVINHLQKLVDKAARLVEEMARRLPRFMSYCERFDAALSRIDDGDVRYVSDPLVDSVHTVWFEMHEDILTVLGRERTE